MLCHSVEMTLESTDPKHVAKAMLDFWKYQYEKSRVAYGACKGRIEGGKRANEQAAADWRADDMDLGFGPPKPFSDAELKREASRLPTLDKDLGEAHAMLDYMVDYIIEKAHETK